MEYKFTIPGRLDGLNEYTAANRTNPHKGGHMKQKNEDGIIWQIRRQLPGIGTITAPVLIYYRFFEKDRRRDNDNILSCAAKFVLDSLRIEVTITELTAGQAKMTLKDLLKDLETG